MNYMMINTTTRTPVGYEFCFHYLIHHQMNKKQDDDDDDIRGNTLSLSNHRQQAKAIVFMDGSPIVVHVNITIITRRQYR